MHEAVSEILLERTREADGVLSRMLLFSSLGHTILIAVLVLMPATWRM